MVKAKDKNYFISCEANACREIVVAKTGVASFSPSTLLEVFKKAIASQPNAPALESVSGKIWTWKQYYDDVIVAATAMIELGYTQFGTAR